MAYDDAGRISTLTENGTSWTYGYDAAGRLTSACKSVAPCPGSGVDRVDELYDGDGHRTKITETPAAGTQVTVTDFRYQGDAVIEEAVSVDGTPSLTRSFVLDDAGRILRMTISAGSGAGTYLVTWNGHGDALGLWLQNADGTLTLANSYTYDTWGTPTTSVAAGFTGGDLGFRYQYVGASDVQWDDSFGLGLLYMHARHYSPSLGRFLQPDPVDAESNLYGYAGNGPVSRADPDGTWWYGVRSGDRIRGLARRFLGNARLYPLRPYSTTSRTTAPTGLTLAR